MQNLLIVVFVLFVNVPQTSSLLDEVKDALGSAKTYLNDLLPLINSGIKAVKKFEEFIDNTIEEDCYFQCPRGHIARARSGHVKTSNGCGSLDLVFNDSEDSWIYVEKEFSSCCETHDVCYDTCGADKDLCDLRFRKCLYRVCRGEDKLNYIDNKKCKLKAKVFYMAVVGVGCQPFKDAQKVACECIKDWDGQEPRIEL